MLNLYCDESCHLENDGIKVMLIGAIACPDYIKETVYGDIRQIKYNHGIPSHREIKWTKVSKGEEGYYLNLVNYFFDNESLSFRCVMLPNKSKLRHEDFDQTHDDFYYKMYYHVINKYLNEIDQLTVYVDIKDTRSIRKVRKLNNILENRARNRFQCVAKIEQIRSHHNSIMQLCDLLTGAVVYVNRGLKTSETKLKLCELIVERTGQTLRHSSAYSEKKFNLLVLDQVR